MQRLTVAATTSQAERRWAWANHKGMASFVRCGIAITVFQLFYWWFIVGWWVGAFHWRQWGRGIDEKLKTSLPGSWEEKTECTKLAVGENVLLGSGQCYEQNINGFVQCVFCLCSGVYCWNGAFFIVGVHRRCSVSAFLMKRCALYFHFMFQRGGAAFYCSWVPRFGKTQTQNWAENAQSKHNLKATLLLVRLELYPL